ncbi:MAG: DNA starvation/stationary phase protection protein Dps [Phycisphaeraceae bacterium]|nr:DNA starvation/stationary phase protection protein Dps [Phycisphaeraceae bacterium]
MSDATPFETRNDLSATIRTRSVVLLQAILADSLDLASQVKHAHWNVKGPHFMPLHELFDTLHEELEGEVDDIAERLTALGGHARGTAREAAKASRLPEFPPDAVDGSAHLKALADRYAALGRSTRQAIAAADDAGDAATADLFTQLVRRLDKHLWFIEAHLQR